MLPVAMHLIPSLMIPLLYSKAIAHDLCLLSRVYKYRTHMAILIKSRAYSSEIISKRHQQLTLESQELWSIWPKYKNGGAQKF